MGWSLAEQYGLHPEQLTDNNKKKDYIMDEWNGMIEDLFDDYDDLMNEPSDGELDAIELTGDDTDWEWREDAIVFDDDPFEM
jgi:hypothetical protein|tara:strand:- start:14560 stop:14805 length:246 start_codon:yes stop_codon:yes gene_type:complete